jgi:glycosyltransferase involved in cell wall biosynthesis
MVHPSKVLSIIIPTYSEQRFSDVCDVLESIFAQSYTDLEVIVSIEASRALLESLRKYAGDHHDVKLVFSPERLGLSANRNHALEHAKGELVAFVDDDVILEQTWAEQAIATFSDNSVVGVTGPVLPLWPQASFDWFPEDLHWIISCTSWVDRTEMMDARNLWGGNMAVRRWAFKVSGGFSTAFGLRGAKGPLAEDNEFSQRLVLSTSKRLVYNPRMVVKHKVRANRLAVGYVVQRSYWIGTSRFLLARNFSAPGRRYELALEHTVLRRMLRRLIHSDIPRLVYDPNLQVARRVLLTVLSLLFASIGYCTALAVSLVKGRFRPGKSEPQDVTFR